MTNSQIQYLRDASDALKIMTIEAEPDAKRRHSKPSWALDKNLLIIKKQGSEQQSQILNQHNRVLNEGYSAQNVAISPSQGVKMLDEMISKAPHAEQNRIKVPQRSSSKTGPFTRYRKLQSSER